MGLCRVSAITQEPIENPIAFLERLKETLQRITKGLRLLQGTGDFKGRFPVTMCIRHQDRVTTVKQQDSAASLYKMVQTATSNFYNREQEREAKAQEREKRKETRYAQMLATLQGSPMANSESLKDKAQGTCLICRQVVHWAKECPNCDKSAKMVCYKCNQLGHWVALCPWDPRASRSSTKPSFRVVQQY